MNMVSKAQVNFLAKLQQKKYRYLQQKFLVASPKVIWEQYDNELLDSIYVTDNFYNENEDKMVFGKTYRISERDLVKISGQVTPAGLVGLFSMPTLSSFSWRCKQVLWLDDIQDAGNLGTIVRTADWFGISDIFLSPNCVDLYNPKVVAATMGSIFNVKIHLVNNAKKTAEEFKKNNYLIIVADLSGQEFPLPKNQKIVLVVGNEARGSSQEIKSLADKKYKIKQFGKAESLNAAVSAGIIMHQLKH